jgi:iron complex outermembrane receptor protein
MSKFKIRLLPLAIGMAVSISVSAQDDATQEREVEEVIVQGVRSAELNARDLERENDAFSSIISQDDAGNFADQNVAEALQRLPGVTLQKTEGEGRFITVRGLGPGFVTVNMNGSELASSNSDTRAFALDAVPADLLGSIEVFKSLTPDMDLNSIGGTVNVKSVSAFDRNKNSLKMNVQNYQQDFDGEASPKISLQGTHLFADDTIGIGYSFSHETRNTKVYETRHHADTNMRYIQVDVPGVPAPTEDSTRMLIPFEFETREEDAERERTAGSLDFGFRPTDDGEYYFRYARTELVDMDIALREYYRFGQALAGHSAYVDLDSNTFGVVNADLQHQYFIQEGSSTTDAYSLGGKNIFSDWTLDYDYSKSTGEFEKPDGRRVQFRTRFLPLLGRFGEDFINGQVISPAQMSDLGGGDFSSISSTIGGFGGANGYQAGERVQSGMLYDNIFIEDSFRTDTLDQISANLRKNYDNGLVNYIKTGFKIKGRERDRNKDRWSIVPSNFPDGCASDDCIAAINSSLGDYGTYDAGNPNFDHNFITLSETERLLNLTTPVAKFTDPNRTDQESRNEDYVLTEDTAAAYFMTELQLSDSSFLIAGLRD